jgi:Membrane domain of glycerophosphoryl diester phosphodiesterase/Uncharacterised protein family (UPF0259)
MLQEAWNLYRRNFGAVLALAMPVWTACAFYEMWKRYVPLREGTLANTLRQEVPVTLLVSILATSAVYYYLGEEAAGPPADLKAAAKAGLEFWSRMFITRFLTGLAVLVGFLLLIVPGIYLAVRLAVVEPLILTEEVAGVDAMRRSWELTNGKFWRVFGWMVVGALPPFILAVPIFLPFAFLRELHDWPMQAVGLSLALVPMTFAFAVTWVICAELRREDYADLG